MSKKAPFGRYEDGTPVVPYGLTGAGNVRQKPKKGETHAPVVLEHSDYNEELAEHLEGVGVTVRRRRYPARANVEPETQPAKEPTQAPQEEEPPAPEDRDWLTLSEVEVQTDLSRTAISKLVSAEMVPGMEPGKQGRPQKWYPEHVERLQWVLAMRDTIRGLARGKPLAEAASVERYRLNTATRVLTDKGMRLLSSSASIDSIRSITRNPVVIIL